MKQVVLNLSTRRQGNKKPFSRDVGKPKSASVHLPASSFDHHDDFNVSKPGSIALVRSFVFFCSSFYQMKEALKYKVVSI